MNTVKGCEGKGLAMDTINLKYLDEFPSPPRILYKYLSSDRASNVLEEGTVRFTPLLNTNDTFEVRSTFDFLAGPKFLSLLSEQMENTLSDTWIHQRTEEALKESGLEFIPTEIAIKIIEQQHGKSFSEMMRENMRQAIDTVLVPQLNDKDNIAKMVEELGRKLLCFSMSDRMDSPVMWAHYAESNAGFVVAFDTESEWFRQRKNGEKTRLQKVTYLEGKVNELLDNPRAAIISKTTDWSYEREWRLYTQKEQADFTVGTSADPIHLLKFPPEAIDRVILGHKMITEEAARICAIVESLYPHAKVTRAIPNPQSHTYEELVI